MGQELSPFRVPKQNPKEAVQSKVPDTRGFPVNCSDKQSKGCG